MSVFAPLFPAYGSGQTAASTATSASMTGLIAEAKTLCITNIGSQVVYLRVTNADDTSAATIADYPVPPNSQVTISKGEMSRLAHVAPGGAGSSIHVIPGEGY